jgi:enoyl-CoA hydratase
VADESGLRYEVDGAIAYLTLDRPDRLNALSHATHVALEEALDGLEADTRVRVAVIRGAGRAFCAGNDLKEMSARPAGAPPPSLWDQRNRIRGHAQLWVKIWDCPKPIIAQVHGYCLAGGVLLATSCDLTFVAENCVIGWPKLPVGGGYISRMLTWYIGPKRAKEMSFIAGSEIDGRTAAEWGLANRAVPEVDLERTVRQVAEGIARMPGSLLALKKDAINSVYNSAGYREEILHGADRDAMSHQDPGVQTVRGWMRELGYKGAIERYEQGGV